MDFSSATPSGALPKRGTPGSNRPAHANVQPPAEPPWPLPRKDVATDAAPPAGKRGRKQQPETEGPFSSGVAAQAQPPRLRAFPSEKVTTRSQNPNDSTEGEITILRPAALNPRQAKNPDRVPPPIATEAQPISSFSFPRPQAPNPKKDAPDAREVLPKPLRTGPPGPVPPIPNTTRSASSQQPQIPEPLRAGTPFGAGPPVPDALRPGMARQGQGPSLFPKQPGPAPAFPVPTPTKSPQRKNTSVNMPGAVPPVASQSLMGANANQTGEPVPALDPFGASGPRERAPANLKPQVGPFARKPVNQDPLSPPRQPINAGTFPGSLDPGMNPLRSSPPNSQPQLGRQGGLNPSVYRPSMSPPRRQDTANFAPPQQMAQPNMPPPRVTSPPGIPGSRPGATYAGPRHAPSSSMDSNMSNDSAATSATATSTRPLNPTAMQRQNTTAGNAFSKPSRQNSDLGGDREKGTPGGGGYTSAEAAQTPYMTMLLSLDRIPRLHNILVAVFVWVLLAGFVVIPGSFTSAKRKQEGETVQIPIGGGSGGDGSGGGAKLALTPANTAAMVVGFVCIVAGTFGSAWLALRWRRNYIWLLNKLYMPLILNALAGLLAAVTNVYTQQAGEWSTQAIVTAVTEASILVVNALLFFVYNWWLLQRVRSDHEEAVSGGREKKEKKRKSKKEKRKKWRGGFLARFRRARTKPPIAAGSVV